MPTPSLWLPWPAVTAPKPKYASSRWDLEDPDRHLDLAHPLLKNGSSRRRGPVSMQEFLQVNLEFHTIILI